MSHSRYVHLRVYFHFLLVGRVIESQQPPTMLRMTPRLLAPSYVPFEGLVPFLKSQNEYYSDNDTGQPETAILKVWRASRWQQWPRHLDLAVWRSRGPLGSSARYPRRNRNPAHHQARIHGNGRRMNPDLGSGTGISYDAQFKHALMQVEPGRKG